MSNIKVELVTPDSLLFSSQASYVTIPAKEGEMGVLPNHSPMVVSLGGGLLSINKEIDNNDHSKFFIFGGVVQVTEKSCTILADEAVALDSASVEQASNRLEDAKQDFEKHKDGLRSIEFQERLNYSQLFSDLVQNNQ